MKSNKNRPTRFYVSLIVLISLIFVFQKVEAFEYKPGYNLSPILKSGNEIFNRLNARFVSASDIQLFVSRPAKISGGNLIKIGQAINQLASQLSFSLENKNTSYFAIIAEQAQNAVAVPPIFIDQEKIIGVFNEVVGGVRSFFGQELVSIPEKKEIGPQPLSPTLQILTEEQKKNLKDIGAKAAATAKQAAKAVFEAVKPKSEMETTAEKVSSVPVIDIAEEQEKLKEEVAAAKEKATDFFNQRFIEEPGKMSVWPISPAVAREQRQKMAEDIRNLFNNLGGFFTKEEIIAQPEERTLIDEGTINLLAAKISAKLPQVQQVLKETRVEKETQTKETQIFIDEKKVQAVAGALEQLKQKQAQDRQDLFSAISLTGRINNISNVTITNPTFSSGAITDGDIPDTITASNYLALSGGTLTGNFLANAASSTITNLTVVNATSTNATTTTLYVSGNVGIGTTSPSEQFAVANRIYVGGSGTSTIENNLQVRGQLKIGTSSTYISGTEINATENFTIRTLSENNHLVLQSLGRVGVSSSTPWGVLSVERNGSNALMPIFVVAEQGTSSPYFIVNDLGRVGIGTTTPGSLFSIQGNALFSGNLSVANLIATGTTRFNGTTYTWPSTGGSANQALLTDGAGTLSWGQGGELANWNKQSNFGVLTLTPTTTIPVWLKDNLYASSSVLIDGNATTTGITYSRGGFISSASSTVAGSLQIAGLLQASSSLSVGGGTALGSTLSVAGTSTLAGLSAGFGTFSSNLVTSGSLSATNLATLSGGFLSTASSTVSNNFIVTGGLNASSTLTVAGASRFYSTFQADSLSTLVGGILANNASSTITNLSIINATSTNATTTSLAVTGNASTSQLVVSNSATLNTLIGNGLFTLNSGLLSTASSTFSSNLNVSGPLSASSTLLVANLSTLSGGFVSQASSTVIGNFIVSGGLNASSTLTVAGNSIFYSNVGIATTSPGALLAVQGDALFSGNLSLANIIATGTVTLSNATPLAFTNSSTSTIPSGTINVWSIATSTTANPILSISSTGVTSGKGGRGRVGIGTANPASQLEVMDTATSTNILITSYGTSGGLMGQFARGTPNSPSAVLLNDSLITVGGIGFDGNDFTPIGKGVFRVRTAENWTTSANGTYLTFETTPIGSVTRAEKMRLSDAGNLGIGTTTPGALLAVQGNALVSGNLNVANITATGTVTAVNFAATGSTTLQNFTANNSTSTNATTTSLAVTGNASTSQLIVSNSATLNTLIGNGLFTLNSGLLSTASSTFSSNLNVSGPLSASSTLLVANLSTLSGGFISSASSTIASSLHISGNLQASSTVSLATTTITVNVASTTPGIPLTLYNTQSATNTANRLAFQIGGATSTLTTSAITSQLIQNYDPGKGILAFSVLNSGLLSEAARFNSDGYYGIGTTDPAAPLQVTGKTTAGNDSSTKLLLHADGSGSSFTDSSSGGKVVTANDNVVQSNVQSKFGGKSAYFDGNGDYLSMADNADFNVGSGDFTIDTWFYAADTSNRTIFASNSDFYLGMFLSSGKMQYFVSSNGTSWDMIWGDSTPFNGLGSITITTNAWHHLAFVRNGDRWIGFIDGVIDIDTTVTGTVATKNEAKNIGRWGNGSYWFNGYIDEFRFSKGIARWTAAFTPSTDAYGTSLGLAAVFQGNVGIGETAPGSNLSVSGGVTIGASYDTTAAPTNGLLVEGNLGIGTTTPGALLAVQGTGLFTNTLTAPNIIATGTLNVTGVTTLTNASTTGMLTIGNGFISQASSTLSSNLQVSGIINASSTLTVAGASRFYSTLQADALSTLAGGLLANNASSTITNLSIINATSTNATTTSLAVTGNASTSQLVVSNASTYGGLANFLNGLISAASSTFSNILNVTGLANLSGFISTASSTVSNNFIVTGGLNASSTLTVAGNSIFYSNVGIGTTSPGALLAVQGNALFSGNLNVANITATGTISVTGTSGTSTIGSLTISPSGKIGIGTSTPNLANFEVATRTIAFNSGADGDLGLWATSTNTFAARDLHSSIIANGYVYVLGGVNGASTVTNTVQFAKLNSNGSVGSWATSTNTFAAREQHSSVTANGYVYVLGGNTGTVITNTVQFAKLNSDGSVGSWTTSANTFAARYFHSSVIANGYIYVLGGQDGAGARTNTVQFAKLNSDGSVGSWATSTNSFTAKAQHSSAIANGYVYVLGGYNESLGVISSVQFAKLNSDGSVGSWATSTNSFAARYSHSSVIANGYVYALGGVNGSLLTTNTAQYAKLNSDGSVGTWATSANTFAARQQYSSVTANGYVYVLGGDDGAAAITNTAQYASTARILVSGNLDLLGLASTTLGDVNSSDFGSVGGSIFAGNIFSAGQLEVTGNTRLWGGLGVNGVLSVTASTSLAQDVPIFSIQNATGTSPILTALYNGNVGIGTAAPVALLSVAGKTALGANAVNLSARNTLSGGRTYIINNEQYVLALGRDTVNQVFYLGTSAITNPDLQFSNNTGTELMRITDSGNVGIGTTTPGALLAVQGNALFSGNLNVANITATGTLSLTGTTGTSTIASGQGFTIGGSQFVVQQGSGNVGIGTTGPLGGLHVVRSYVDSLNASVRVAGNIPGISFDDTDGAATNRNFAILNSYNNVGLLDFNYSSAQGGAPTLTAMTIDGSAGNVGIGTTSPAQLLAVAGDVYIHNGATQENLRVNNGAVCADNNGATKCNAALTAGASYFDSENIGASDLAENYPVKDESIEAGDIVALTSDISASQNQEKERFKDKAERENSREAEHMQEMLSTTLVKATPETSYKIIGAISTNPGITLGDTTGMTLDTETRPVALSGRIPVKVNLEGGAIVVGDPITISSIPGVGKKANQSGKIIGYALENYNGLTKENGDKILAFTSVGYWLGPDILNATSTNSSLALSQSNGLLAQVVDTVKSWLESLQVFIEDGLVRLKNLVAEKITTQTLCVEDVCVDKAGLQALLLNAGINSLSSAPTTATSAPVIASSTPAADTEPPVITLIGESVISIEKGISWVDPGATVTDNVNDNLGIYYKVDGVETGNGGRDLPQTAIDTNIIGNHTITYTSTDSAGNVGTAARTVNIVDPAAAVSDTAAVSDIATATTTTTTTATATATATNP